MPHRCAEQIPNCGTCSCLLRVIAIVAFAALPSQALSAPGVPEKTGEAAVSDASPVTLERAGGGSTPGALAGKLVFVSQGHGFIYDGSIDGWRTQRGNTHDIVEDLIVAEAVNQYLVPMLELAGATVLTVRDRDLQSEMVIVDDGDGAPFYVESGDAGSFSDSGQPGFANGMAPYSPGTNPFMLPGGTDRLLTTSGSETARATYTPHIPRDGHYTVYVSYTLDGSDRASDAHYIVRHSGGETHFRVNQELHGGTWIPLGRFHFRAGLDSTSASVVLANDSGEVGDTVSADAVRFGGGMGEILRGGDVSGRPRWEEGAQTYVQFLGAPESVYAPSGTPGDDISARSRWAAWENVAGVDDSVYVSWHTNAPSPARGTRSFIYSPNAPDGTYDDSHAVAGSAELMNLIHDEMVGDIRELWDPTWNDRGYASAYFGELNPSNNSEMPSCMILPAFHATQADAEALKEPRFNRLIARAVLQGIIRYFAQRDTIETHLPPEPPREIEVRAIDETSAVVAWTPPVSGGAFGDPATYYRVYQSAGGKGFDNGTESAQTSLTLTGLTPGVPRYVRVSSVNDGGESLPSETLVVTSGVGGDPRVVVVNGFDRLDRFMLVDTDLSAYSLGTVQRMFLDSMNTFDYVIEHAEALQPLDVVVDSASNEAVVSGRRILDPATDDVVVWILGRESTDDETFSDAEQSLLAAYLAAGGTLFVSGAELGWDLAANGSSSDQAFYDTTLLAQYVADDAGVHSAAGMPGSILDGISLISFDDGTFGGYGVDYPDVVAPRADAALCATYDGSSDGACLEVDTGTYRLVYLAFPFESITSQATRADVMAAVMNFLVPPTGPVFADRFELGAEGN